MHYKCCCSCGCYGSKIAKPGNDDDDDDDDDTVVVLTGAGVVRMGNVHFRTFNAEHWGCQEWCQVWQVSQMW